MLTKQKRVSAPKRHRNKPVPFYFLKLIAIVLESIKKDGVSEQEVAKGVAQQYPRPSFSISIRDLLKNINIKMIKNLLPDFAKRLFVKM